MFSQGKPSRFLRVGNNNMINILTNEFGFEIANLTVITNKRVTVIPAQKQLYIKY